MASQEGDNALDSTTKTTTKSESLKIPSSNVRFDLEESQRADHSNESLDEVDEFMELSTLSNHPSTSSFDSIHNGPTINSKTSTINGTTYEHKSTLKNYSRYVRKLFT